jgi:hypothetical protein
VRVLFAFDPWRSSMLLVCGDKSGQWNAGYWEAMPLAEQRYETYLKERHEEEKEREQRSADMCDGATFAPTRWQAPAARKRSRQPRTNS